MPDETRPHPSSAPPDEARHGAGREEGGPGDSGRAAAPALGAAVGWYILSLGAIGALAGLFAGLSKSPVIGTLLPLLFTLIGGTGGVYLARMRLHSAEERRVLGYLGKAVLLFSVACLAGALLGISIRTGRLGGGAEAAAGWPGLEQASSLQEPELLTLGVLDRKLRVAGIAPAVREQLLLQTAEAARASGAVPEEDVRRLREAIQRVTAALETARARDEDQKDFMPFRTRRLHFLLPELDEHLAFLQAGRRQGDRAMGAHYASILERLERLVDDFLQQDRQAREELDWLARHGFDYSTVLELRWIIESALSRALPPVLREGSAQAELDELVEMTLEGVGRPAQRAEEPFAFEVPPP